jgi:integrase
MMPSLTRPKSKRKGQPTRTSSIFHIRYYCPFRRRSVAISTRCKSRRNAEKCLREFCDLLERGEVGRENPFLLQRRQRVEEADRLAIAECLTAFESDLRAGRVRRGKRKAVSRAHADLTMGRVRKIVEGCGLKRASDLSTDAVNRLLDRLQETGEIRTQQTRKHHERAIKSFGRWLAATERLERDPLTRLEVTCVEAADVVHGRGAFTTEEIERIAAAARNGPAYRGLSGAQRSLLYVFASSTGLRAKECAAVRKGDFGPGLAHVRVAGMFTKSGKDAVQPIPSFLRPALTEYVAPLGDDDFLWPGGWKPDGQGGWVETGWIAGKEAGEFLRKDAAGVGIVIGRTGQEANGGRVLDFHSFRHAYVTQLARAGISEELSRKLARASCRAILERYTHREFEELAAAAEALPALGGAGGDGVPGQSRAATDPPIPGASLPAGSALQGAAGDTPPDEGG